MPKTKNAGAVRGGAGRFYFDMALLKKIDAGGGYSTSHGGVVEGARMMVALITKPRGTGSRVHVHKNEQFNYVLRGTLRCEVGGRKRVAGPGTLIYIPANTPHATIATQDEDVVFLAIKDLSAKIAGIPVDRKVKGAYYDPGFEPKKNGAPPRNRRRLTSK